MRKLIPLSSLLLLGACTVGPDYAGPPRVLPPIGDENGSFVRATPTMPEEEPQLARWWRALDDPVLNQLEQQALAASPDLAVARARVEQARAALRIERRNDYPTVSATGTAAHLRLPGLDLGSEEAPSDGASAVTFFNLGLNASWEIDLFGGGRRLNQAERARFEAAEASVADAQVTLTAAVAQSYLQLREAQLRIALGERQLDARRQVLEFIRQRFERGTASQIHIEQQQAEIRNAEAQLLPSYAEAAAFQNALAILTGQIPGSIDALVSGNAAIPLPPASVAVGDPAALLRRRPDIRAAERQLAAATDRIGATEAARLPRLSFMGILGIGGTRLTDLGQLDDFTTIAAPMLEWNLLDFGQAKARVNQAEAARDEAEAAYRAVVLAALRDVEDALAAFRYRREVVASLARAEESTARIVELMGQRYQAGVVAQTEVIEAERQHLAAEQALVSGKTALTIAFVQVEKALGLGWSAGPET
ncbi:efflux transporter outer membrane subunit [Altericroceibacterium xinjiangense]|uniref:efflux transporter outer membrane subunit n=1 Tax=Altericroceibacterium xinjiangense TaxID=762261 RepID=UPI000F7F545F|nr:efflux transporter outer membrane subunit [Altericroceibacterium xinjiangense]